MYQNMNWYQALLAFVVLFVMGCDCRLLHSFRRDDFGDAPAFISVPSEVTVKEPVSLSTPIATVRVDLPENIPGHHCMTNHTLFFDLQKGTERDIYYLFATSDLMDPNFRYLWNGEQYFDVPIICTVDLVSSNPNQLATVTIKTIRVHVVDDSDNGPVFDQDVYETNVTENVILGSIIQQVSASDQKVPNNAHIEYRLENDFDSTFAIDSQTGDIYVYRMIDHEKKAIYNVRVLAIDQGSPRLTGYASVQVNVIDVNDNIPKFTKEKFVFEVPREVSIGTEVGRVTAEDRDSGEYGKIHYSLDVMSEVPFYILNDGVIITDKVLNNMELKCQYEFYVMAQDSIGMPMLSKRNYVKVVVKILNC